MINDAFHIIDDNSCIVSGWDYFDDGEGPKKSWTANRGWRLNSDKSGEVCLRRDCTEFSDGIMTYERKFELVGGNGLYFHFGNRNKAFLRLDFRNGEIWCGDRRQCDICKCTLRKLPVLRL